MLEFLLGTELYQDVLKCYNISEITEISIRSGLKITVKNRTSRRSGTIAVCDEDIKRILARATKNSLYACQDEIKNGYVTFNGIRIGLSGTAVVCGDHITTIKNISSLNIRIPHEVKGCADPIKKLLDGNKGILVISPPLCGKTTLIRDLARISSYNTDTLIVDERAEIYSENYTFGPYIDIMRSAPKSFVTEGILRAMAPETVVFDEIYFKRDSDSLTELSSAGVRIIGSAHIVDLESSPKNIREYIAEHFDYVVALSNNPSIGSIKSIIKTC